MGWTGSGIPKMAPVRMLNKPVNTRVEGKSMQFEWASAIMSGSSVPRSPTAPEISAAGERRIVSKLYRLTAASLASCRRIITPAISGCLSYVSGVEYAEKVKPEPDVAER